MNIAKVLSALNGYNEITKEIYEQAKDLEFSRIKRVLSYDKNNISTNLT